MDKTYCPGRRGGSGPGTEEKAARDFIQIPNTQRTLSSRPYWLRYTYDNVIRHYIENPTHTAKFNKLCRLLL